MKQRLHLRPRRRSPSPIPSRSNSRLRDGLVALAFMAFGTSTGLTAQGPSAPGTVRLETGDRLAYVIESTTDHSVEGRDHRGQAIKKNSGYRRQCQMHLDLRVQSKASNGGWRVGGNIKRVVVGFPVPGSPVVLDSGDSTSLAAVQSTLEQAGVWNTAGAPLMELVGQEFTFSLDKCGQVSGFRGLSTTRRGTDSQNKRDHASLLLIGALCLDSDWQTQLQALLFGGVPGVGARVLDSGWTRSWTVRPFDPNIQLGPPTQASRGAVGGLFNSGGLATDAPVVAPPEPWECTATYLVGKSDADTISTSFRSGSVVLVSKRLKRDAERKAEEKRRAEAWLRDQYRDRYSNSTAQDIAGVPIGLRGLNLGLPTGGYAPGSRSPGGQIVWEHWNREVDAMFPTLEASALSPVPNAKYRVHGDRSPISRRWTAAASRDRHQHGTRGRQGSRDVGPTILRTENQQATCACQGRRDQLPPTTHSSASSLLSGVKTTQASAR